jgi:hypothetical protein
MKTICISLELALLMVLFCSVLAHCQENTDDQTALRKTFETEYEAWKKDCDRVMFSSDTNDRLKSEHFKKIISMGPKVLPYLFEKRVSDPNFTWIGIAYLYLIRINPDPSENPYAKESVQSWWQGRQKQVDQRFESTYKKWKEYNTQSMSVEADKMYNRIKALGIAAFPKMINKIEEGDTEFIAAISQLTENQIKKDATRTEALSWWEQNKEDWLIPFPNKQPKAKAGKDTIAKSGDLVTLDGSASSDADKDILTYKWTQIAGPSVTLSDNTAVKPTFTAPVVQQQTVLTFQLMVNDGSPKKSVHPSCGSGESDPNTVNITVRPK